MKKILNFILSISKDPAFWVCLLFVLFFSVLAAALGWGEGKNVFFFGMGIVTLLFVGNHLNKIGVWK